MDKKMKNLHACKTLGMSDLFKAFLSFVILALVVEVVILVTTKAIRWNPAVSGRPWVVSAHVHILVLGALFTLIMMLLDKAFNITKTKLFTPFFIVYLVAFSLLLAFILYKGFTQLLGGTPINGLLQAGAGLAHTTMFVSLFMFCATLKQALSLSKSQSGATSDNQDDKDTQDSQDQI